MSFWGAPIDRALRFLAQASRTGSESTTWLQRRVSWAAVDVNLLTVNIQLSKRVGWAADREYEDWQTGKRVSGKARVRLARRAGATFRVAAKPDLRAVHFSRQAVPKERLNTFSASSTCEHTG